MENVAKGEERMKCPVCGGRKEYIVKNWNTNEWEYKQCVYCDGKGKVNLPKSVEKRIKEKKE